MKVHNQYDRHIILELKKIKTPIETKSGSKVYFQNKKHGETIFEHISNIKHHLYIKDIFIIENILKNSTPIIDKKVRNF